MSRPALGERVRIPPTGLDAATLRKAPVVALLAANLLPLAGVLLLGWDLGLVMLLFWAENGVVGFFGIVKMAAAARWGAIVLVPFFVVHFGGFMMAHLLFLLLFFVIEDPFDTTLDEFRRAVGIDEPFVWIALAALLISHTVSFIRHFARDREGDPAQPVRLMMAPYKRVVVLHITIVLGGFLVLGLGQPVAALVLLVTLKTAVDLFSHVHEHRQTYQGTENPTGLSSPGHP
jgi:hypothetical protein